MIFVLEVINKEVEAKVYLNDRLVFAGNDLESKTTQMRITHLMKPGKNLIKVDVSSFKDETASPGFKLSVLGGERGTQPGEETLLLNIESSSFYPQFFAKTKSYIEEFAFDVNKTDSSVEHYNAERLDIVETVFDNTKNLIKQLQKALVNKDLETFKTLLQVRNKELAAISKMELAQFEQGMGGFLDSLFSSDDWDVKKIDYDALQYDIESDGRVLHVYSDITRPLVEASGSGRVIDVDIRVAQIESKLQFVY